MFSPLLLILLLFLFVLLSLLLLHHPNFEELIELLTRGNDICIRHIGIADRRRRLTDSALTTLSFLCRFGGVSKGVCLASRVRVWCGNLINFNKLFGPVFLAQA